MKKVTIQVPATSANCGPGFDTLGLACTLYNEVTYEITEAKGFKLQVTGEGCGIFKALWQKLSICKLFACLE